MRIIKKYKRHYIKKVALVVAVLLVPIVLYIGSAYTIKIWPFSAASKQQDQQAVDTPTQLQGSGEKSEGTNITQNTANTTKDESPIAETTTQSSDSLTITAANQDGDLLRVRTLIVGLDSTGTCTLTFTKGSTVVTLTSGIQPGPSSSTCQGFDVSVSGQQLSVGEWLASVKVRSGSIETIASIKVTIQ